MAGGETKYVNKLSPDAELQYSGNCLDADNENFTIKTLTYAYISRPDVQQWNEPDPQSSIAFSLEDEKGMKYSFAAYEYLLDSEYLISGAKLGDTGDFVILDKYPVLPVNGPIHVPDIMGDINEDRVFDLADEIVLNRWLLTDPDVKVSDWMAADFNKDGKLDATDLLLIKQALWDDRAKPSCTLNIVTSYGGTGFDGHYSGGSSTQSFTVKAGDWFHEDGMAGWVKNGRYKHCNESRLLTVKDITGEGVLINYIDIDSSIIELEYSDRLIPFGESRHVMSNIRIMDGYSYSHSIVFSDYDAGGAK